MQKKHVTFGGNGPQSARLRCCDSGTETGDGACSVGKNGARKGDMLDAEAERLECFVSDMRLHPDLRAKALTHMLSVEDARYSLGQWQDASDYLLDGWHGATVAEIKRRIAAYLKENGAEA